MRRVLTLTEGTALRDLRRVRGFYELPNDDIASELLIPAMGAAQRVRIMAGFFSSRSFSQLAPGLAAFINGSSDPLELLISPRISEQDRDAIRRALVDPAKVAQEAARSLFEGAKATQSAIAAHVVDCLAYLVAQGRLRLKFVLMKQGMFHPKVWLFELGADVIVAHGSSNPTEEGLIYNGETVSVERPWKDGEESQQRVVRFVQMFEGYWNNERDRAVTVDAEEGLRFAGDHPLDHIPTTEDFWRAWYEDAKNGLAPNLPDNLVAPTWVGFSAAQRLRIPASLVWETGSFGHQGSAVHAWEAAGGRGILAIATGGGKTVASFVAATRLQDQCEDPLLVIVLAPTTPLIDQWDKESRRFGVRPYVLGRMTGETRAGDLHGIVSGLSHGVAKTEVVICSNKLFTGSEPLRTFLAQLGPRLKVMLIADEVHNLGTRLFLQQAPQRAEFRLGLSATPVRQYDSEGTAGLLEFFGSVVFEFALAEAIKAGCLSHYNYYLHEVDLAEYEMDEWRRLTEQLRKRGFFATDEGQGNLDDAIQRLLEARRSVLEHAEGKLAVLTELLRQTPPKDVSHTLIYTSAKKDPLGRDKQIVQVNRLLNDLGVISHQLTYTETGAKKAQKMIEDFGKGTYQALTCMKVLDEGVDVPATTHAYILSSSTVRREWIQRRGRVLRLSKGKDIAHIHDFFVVPPDLTSADSKGILRAELQRADEFASLADNAWDNDGPRSLTVRFE